MIELLIAGLIGLLFGLILTATGWGLSDWRWWIFNFLFWTLVILLVEVIVSQRMQ